LHPQRARIEQALAARERTLFNLDDTIYLYDLTSTYFEGRCPFNPQAKRGYSRDHRPDCKQVVIGLVLDRDGFPKAHEVFDGNRQDRSTVADMLTRLEERTGRRGGATVVVDRGMAFAENLAQIRTRGHHYLVAARYPERGAHHDAFADAAAWTEVIRVPSPRNPGQKKTRVFIKRQTVGDEVHILCRSDARIDKDRAIRDKHEQRLLADLQKLQARVAHGRLRAASKVQEAIGRLKERYPRVARYYAITYDAATRTVSWTEQTEKKTAASTLDGTYLLRTDRQDLADDEVWRLYISPLHLAHARRGRLPRDEKPADGAADLPPPRAARADAHLPLRARLPSARRDREALSRSWVAHLVGHAARATVDPPGGDRGAAGDRRPHPENPQGVHARRSPPRDLSRPPDPRRGHEGGEDLDGGQPIVTQHLSNLSESQHSAPAPAEVGLARKGPDTKNPR
jgi:hypothetical protein